jgi:hypothetical protein
MKTLLVRTVDQWRHWLAEHHDSESEVWPIYLLSTYGQHRVVAARSH